MKLNEQLKQFILAHESDNIHDLALKANKYKGLDVNYAIQQIKGRQIAKIKIPSWYDNAEIIYPRHLSMEQCSSEYTARYKADLCEGNTMVDLTGGFGVDIAFLSSKFPKATYIEQQAELYSIAKHNFKILDLCIDTHNTTSESYLEEMVAVDLIYIDPARRDDIGRKTVRIEDCTPNVIEIEELLEKKSKKTMIKLSPMLDISLALNSVKNVSDVYVISHNNECKELLFVKDNANLVAVTNIHCVNIIQGKAKVDNFIFTKVSEDTLNISYAKELGKYLYEPNSSILKAGAYKSVANQFKLQKLHPNSHLYTSDDLIESFPGRIFNIEAISSPDKKSLRKSGEINKANLSTRNFPISTQELAKKLNIKDGGNIYLFGTTMADEKKILIICHKVVI